MSDDLPESLRDPMAVLKRGQELHAEIIERRLVDVIRDADKSYQASTVGGTRPYVSGYLIPALARHGLRIDVVDCFPVEARDER